VIRIHCQHGTEQYIESKLALNKVHTSTKAADTTKLLLLKKWVKKTVLWGPAPPNCNPKANVTYPHYHQNPVGSSAATFHRIV